MSSLSPRSRAADDYGSSNDHDDPLAELARIVAETSSFEPARPAARRVEPQIDFEAELINELRASIDVANDHAPPAPNAVVDPRARPGQPAHQDDDAAFDRALYAPEAYDTAPQVAARAYEPSTGADPRYADEVYAEPPYEDGYADDPRYARAYSDGYEPTAYRSDAYAPDAYPEEAYADDGHARETYPVDAYAADPYAPARSDVSLDDFERDLAVTTRQSVDQGRGYEPRAEPAFDNYDDYDDYDRLPPVETDLRAERGDAADVGPTTPLAAEPVAEGRLGMKIAAAAMGLVVIGGLGFLGYRAFGPNAVTATNGAPPVIKAEAQPAKVIPQGATPAKTESDRVAPANQQRIVAKQEEPVETVGNKQVRVVGPGAQPAEGEDDAPRRVRTVVVRPDGTIVQPNAGATPALPPVPAPAAVAAPPAAAPAAAPAPTAPSAVAAAPAPAPAPVAAPAPAAPAPALAAVPAVPAPGVRQPQPAPTRPAETQAAPVATPPATPAARPAPPPPAAVAATRPVPPAPQPVAPTPRAAAPAASAPLPLVPPTGAPAAAAPATVAALPATPAPAAPASGGGSFVVQLSSQRSEADARRDFQRFQSRFGGLLAGKSADIQTADLGNRGVYYRLRVGPGGSREDAVRLCEQIKSQGGDCVVARR